METTENDQERNELPAGPGAGRGAGREKRTTETALARLRADLEELQEQRGL